MCVWVCVCVCVSMRVCVCECVCVNVFRNLKSVLFNVHARLTRHCQWCSPAIRLADIIKKKNQTDKTYFELWWICIEVDKKLHLYLLFQFTSSREELKKAQAVFTNWQKIQMDVEIQQYYIHVKKCFGEFQSSFKSWCIRSFESVANSNLDPSIKIVSTTKPSKTGTHDRVFQEFGIRRETIIFETLLK
jgi:hypothetical protein